MQFNGFTYAEAARNGDTARQDDAAAPADTTERDDKEGREQRGEWNGLR
jgi:hypothetical protein